MSKSNPAPRISYLLGAFLFALFVVLFARQPTFAQSVGSFVQNVHLSKDASLDVKENIFIDFANSSRQSVYRVIPIEYEGFAGKYRSEIKVINVCDENYAPIDFTQNRLGSTYNIRITRPNLPGITKHIFRLHYLVRHAVCFLQRAQLYWNASGDAWPMNIDKASVLFTAPRGVDPSTITVRGYVAASPSKSVPTRPITPEQDGNTFILRAQDIKPSQGLVLFASLPKGAVSEPNLLQQLRWFLADWWPSVLMVFVTLGGSVAVWWVCGRESVPPLAITLPATPPPKLSPCEVGTLLDENCGMHDISSTLVNLAVRGFLNIEEIESNGFLSLSNRDYRLSALRSFDDEELARHERLLLKSIFGPTPAGVVKLSELQGKFSAFLPAIKEAVYADLIAKGQFTCSPDEVKKSYYGAGIALVLVGTVTCLVWRESGSLAPAIGNGFVISGLIILIFAPLMRARTVFGSRALWQTRALEKFMLRHSLKTSLADKPEEFERLLPYAMVLGVSDKWAEAFHGLLVTPPQWFRSADADDDFSSEKFVGALGNGMRTVEKVLASKPQ